MSIEQATQKILKELDEYENECKMNLDTSNFVSLVDEFKELNEATRKNLSLCTQKLNKLQYEEEKFKQIATDCDQSASEILERLKSFKQQILMNRLTTKTKSVDLFCGTKIDFTTR